MTQSSLIYTVEQLSMLSILLEHVSLTLLQCIFAISNNSSLYMCVFKKVLILILIYYKQLHGNESDAKYLLVQFLNSLA